MFHDIGPIWSVGNDVFDIETPEEEQAERDPNTEEQSDGQNEEFEDNEYREEEGGVEVRTEEIDEAIRSLEEVEYVGHDYNVEIVKEGPSGYVLFNILTSGPFQVKQGMRNS